MKVLLIVAAFIATFVIMLCIVMALCGWFVRRYRVEDTDKIRQSGEKTYAELLDELRECIKSGDYEKARELNQKIIEIERSIPFISTPYVNYPIQNK